MIKLLFIVMMVVVTVYCLQQILGHELFCELVRYPIEYLTKYRMPDCMQGIYSRDEQDELAKRLKPFFTAITGTNLYFDKHGWQYLEFEVVQPSTGVSEGVRQAIMVETRNHIKTSKGVDNSDIFVPVLSEHSLCIQIACSQKAHELAGKLDFSEPKRNCQPLDETIV
jgi:hypothetical protein